MVKKQETQERVREVALDVADKIIPGAGLASKVVGGVFKTVMEMSLERKVGRWLSDVSAAMEFGTPERLAETIHERCEEPWAYEGVVQGIRLALEAVDPAVIPSLAALSADYFASERAPDRFYRRCSRLLIDCGEGELGSLAGVLAGMEKVARAEGRIEVVGGEEAEGWQPVVFEFIADPCASDLGRVKWKMAGSSTLLSVLRLLRNHGFADGAVTRDQVPIPFSQGSAELRSTTRIADHQLAELGELQPYVVVLSSRARKL